MTLAEQLASGAALGGSQPAFVNGAPVRNWYSDWLATNAGLPMGSNAGAYLPGSSENTQATPENIAARNKLIADKIAASRAAANPGDVAPGTIDGPGGGNIVGGGGFMDVPNGALAGPAGQPQRGGAFLPPYLQPGGLTQIQPQSMLDRNAPAGSWDTINNGVPNIPGGVNASPFGRAGVTPTLTGVPGGITPRTGTPGTVAGILNQYNTGGRGGFSATAKLLELPYYLRRLGG